jgi:hypothetical protein
VQRGRPAAEAIAAEHEDLLHVHRGHARHIGARGTQLARQGRLAPGELPCAPRTQATARASPRAPQKKAPPCAHRGCWRLEARCRGIGWAAAVPDCRGISEGGGAHTPRTRGDGLLMHQPAAGTRASAGGAAGAKAAAPLAIASEHTSTLRHILDPVQARGTRVRLDAVARVRRRPGGYFFSPGVLKWQHP